MCQGIGMTVQVNLSKRAPVAAVLQGVPEHSLKFIGAPVAVRHDARNSFAPFLRQAWPRQNQGDGHKQTREGCNS
jgi:hypothetical protein